MADNIEKLQIKNHSPLYRKIMGGAALLCIAIQFPGSLWLSCSSLMLWLLLLAIKDRGSLRRLWLPRFWIITLLFSLACGLFLGAKNPKVLWGIFSLAGLEAGMFLLIRGCFIFSLAIWISRSISQKDLTRLTQKIGLPQLGLALFLAFQLLPTLSQRLRHNRNQATANRNHLFQWYKQLYRFWAELIYNTAILAREITMSPSPLANTTAKFNPAVDLPGSQDPAMGYQLPPPQ